MNKKTISNIIKDMRSYFGQHYIESKEELVLKTILEEHLLKEEEPKKAKIELLDCSKSAYSKHYDIEKKINEIILRLNNLPGVK